MRRAREFGAVRRVYFRPEFRTCPVCGTPLGYSHPVWRKHIIGMKEVIWAGSLGYRCPRPECGSRVYRSAEAESLSLKGSSYGFDVLIAVGTMRTVDHCTRAEIHAELRQRGVPISERHVQDLYEAYLALLCCTARRQVEAAMPRIEKNGGMVISLDGIQPEKGNEALWVVREVLTGVVLTAANVQSASSARLQELLRPVVEMGLPILGVVSDGQHSIKLAVKALLPGVPHQCCQFHYLRDVALPFSDDDRKLRTEVRKKLRGILRVEEKVAGRDDPEAEVVRGYCAAIRAVLLDDGRPPLEPGGIRAYENMERIYSSLTRCLAVSPTRELETLARIAARHREQEEQYLALKVQHGWLVEVERAIDPDNYPGLPPQEAVNQAQDRLQAIVAQVNEVAATRPEHRRFAESLSMYTRGFGDSLFTCFLNPLIPRTNNDLERFLRRAKGAHRRTTGRASWDGYIVRYGELAAYATSAPPETLARWFAEVRTDEYRAQMRYWRARQEPRRQRLRYRKMPAAYLESLERSWLAHKIRAP